MAGGTGNKSSGRNDAKAPMLSPTDLALLASSNAAANFLLTTIGTSLALSAPPAIAQSIWPSFIDCAALIVD